MSLSLGLSSLAADAPKTKLSNGVIDAVVYLPNVHSGYYRGTRFDWAGVIASLSHEGHHYYGPWFTKTDPHVIDFIFDGNDITAGPCSAITGPVEEFTTHEKALGFDEAKPGHTFIKIGVGVLRRPDDKPYSPYRPYEIVDSGRWDVTTLSDSIEFTQVVADETTGYAYRYTKTLRLVPGKAEMVMEHKLENTGEHVIETSVYNHNFFVPDSAPVGPQDVVTLPFEAEVKEKAPLSIVKGHEFTYERALTGKETVAVEFTGFAHSPQSYHFKVENRNAGSAYEVTSDQPLSRLHLWSIRSVVAVEPFLDFTIQPRHSVTWQYHYRYYTANLKD